MTVDRDDQEEFVPTTGETAEARLRRMARRRSRRFRPEEIIPITFVVLAVIALLFWLVGLRGRGPGTAAPAPLPSPTGAVAMGTETPQMRPFTPTSLAPTVATQPPPPTEAPAVPSTIAPGVYVKVTGTGPDMLSFRTGPGLNYARLVKPGTEDEPFLLADGTILKVLEGPELADDMRWWRLQTTDASQTIGWAVEQYLVPVAPPGQ